MHGCLLYRTLVKIYVAASIILQLLFDSQLFTGWHVSAWLIVLFHLTIQLIWVGIEGAANFYCDIEELIEPFFFYFQTPRMGLFLSQIITMALLLPAISLAALLMWLCNLWEVNVVYGKPWS